MKDMSCLCEGCRNKKSITLVEIKEVDSSQELYKLAIEKWGKDAQIGMFIEEIGETLVALNKMNRTVNGITKDEFIQELIDLEIMLEQMKVMFFTPEWEPWKTNKLIRLGELLGADEGE